ncbi:MAG: hypothetical protein R3E85_07530 [Planctomycetota bacterium]
MLGHKTSDLIGSSATIIPGVSNDDNNPITRVVSSGRTRTRTATSPSTSEEILNQSGEQRLGNNLGF